MDPKYQLPFKEGQTAEAKSFEDGFRGAWFRCKIQEISHRRGHWSALLQYFDYPDEKWTWTEFYQVPPYQSGKSEEMWQLMLRPEYPPIHLNNILSVVSSNPDAAIVVEGTWGAGDCVDWWNEDCFWSGKVKELLDNGKAKIELVAPPLGEGETYEVFVKDLRPSLDWSLEFGWAEPASQDGERSCHALPKNPGKPSSKRNFRPLEDGESYCHALPKNPGKPSSKRNFRPLEDGESSCHALPKNPGKPSSKRNFRPLEDGESSHALPKNPGKPFSKRNFRPLEMVGDDKGKSIMVLHTKKRKVPVNPRRPMGIDINEPQPTYIPPRASLSATRLSQQSRTAPTHAGPPDGYPEGLSAPVIVPTSGYSTLQGYSHLFPEAAIPLTSGSQSATPPPTGSVGLASLRLRDSVSVPDTPMIQHSDVHASQPDDSDVSRRIIIEPEGFNFKPDKGISEIIVHCISTHYKGFCPTWSSIPALDQQQMFNEFKNYCIWAPEHDAQIEINFRCRAAKRLHDLFWNARRHAKIPKFIRPVWTMLAFFWATDEKFKRRSEIGKKARASRKGCSMHTSGAVSQTIVRKTMEKDLGRPITRKELFKTTHTKKKKKKNPTDDDRWVEPRAQQMHSSSSRSDGVGSAIIVAKLAGSISRAECQRYAVLKAQLDSFFQSEKIIPPSPSDAHRGLHGESSEEEEDGEDED